MPVLYISSSRPRAGKTALACALARWLTSAGHSTIVVKAITSTLEDDPDPLAYQRLMGQPPTPDLPISVAQEQLQRAPSPAMIAQVKHAVARLAQSYALVIVEGLSVPDRDGDALSASQQLAQELDARVLLVVGFEHGISPTAVTSQTQVYGQRLTGVVLNGVTCFQEDWVSDSLIPALQGLGLPALGWLPERRTLLGVTVGEIARCLNGHFLNGEDRADELVEHLRIGGLVLDIGTTYFEQASPKAVIVRGDRPDIQMAALHTPTACLVLAGDQDPIEYVRYEAEEEHVPLVKVPYATLEASRRLEELLARVQFQHPHKLEQMTSLIAERLDLRALSHSLGL